MCENPFVYQNLAIYKIVLFKGLPIKHLWYCANSFSRLLLLTKWIF